MVKLSKIFCENNFCIYWNEDICICDSVYLNAAGLCIDGIPIDIDETVLEKKRKEGLRKIDQGYGS